MQTPILFYPLTVICIDDNQSVLETLKANLSEQYPITIFTSPHEALQEINKQHNNLVLENFLKNITNNEDANVTELQLNVKIAQLAKLSKIPDRCNEICIIISDYSMPEINGIEFLKNISQLDVKKILLTEYQEYQTVLSAFNSGTINRFLLKTNDNLITELRMCLSQLTREYFVEQTKQLRNNIETNCRLPLSDPDFEKFFLNLLKDMNIKEYYLIDKLGSFLLIDSNNERFYLVVHTEKSLNDFTNLYSEPDCRIFVDQIMSRRKIPYFGDVDPSSIDLGDWGKYLHVPQKYIGEKLYYWCIFKEEVYNV